MWKKRKEGRKWAPWAPIWWRTNLSLGRCWWIFWKILWQWRPLWSTRRWVWDRLWPYRTWWPFCHRRWTPFWVSRWKWEPRLPVPVRLRCSNSIWRWIRRRRSSRGIGTAPRQILMDPEYFIFGSSRWYCHQWWWMNDKLMILPSIRGRARRSRCLAVYISSWFVTIPWPEFDLWTTWRRAPVWLDICTSSWWAFPFHWEWSWASPWKWEPFRPFVPLHLLLDIKYFHNSAGNSSPFSQEMRQRQ